MHYFAYVQPTKNISHAGKGEYWSLCAFICQDIVLYTAQMAVLWHAYILLIASLSLEQC